MSAITKRVIRYLVTRRFISPCIMEFSKKKVYDHSLHDDPHCNVLNETKDQISKSEF